MPSSFVEIEMGMWWYCCDHILESWVGLSVGCCTEIARSWRPMTVQLSFPKRDHNNIITVYQTHWICYEVTTIMFWKGWINKQWCLIWFYQAWFHSSFCQILEMLLCCMPTKTLSFTGKEQQTWTHKQWTSKWCNNKWWVKERCTLSKQWTNK